MPYWIPILVECICAIIIIGVLLSFTSAGKKVFHIENLHKPISSNISLNEYLKATKISQQEPKNHPPIIFDVIFILCCIFTLLGGIFIVVIAIKSKILPEKFNINWLITIILLLGLPIWGISDTLIFERKQNKLSKSYVAKEKTVDIKGNIGEIFDICIKAITSYPHIIWILEKPKIIKASWHGSVISIKMSNLGHSVIRVQILSDARWTTAKWDFGKNQKNIDTLVRIITQEATTKTTDSERTIGIETNNSIINIPRAKIINQDKGIESKDSIINAPDLEINDNRNIEGK
jgi:hypothetical protein